MKPRHRFLDYQSRAIQAEWNQDSLNTVFHCATRIRVISNIKDGDHIYSISTNGLVTNRTTLNSIELTNGITIISKKEKEIQEYYTLATENRYLELLMLDANEEYENPYTGRVINKKMLAIPDNMESNMVEIKFKDAFNNEKKIVLTYTK